MRPPAPPITANTDVVPPGEQEMASFDTGLNLSQVDKDKQDGANRLAEEAMVKKWFERLDAAREFDRSAYAQLALDRCYARGDSSFKTKSNVIGSFIDTWTGLLYAKEPEVDVSASPQVGEPDLTIPRLFGDTMQIVISKLWTKANLKCAAKPWVRAGLTSSVAWLKVTWQQRNGADPVTDQAISDLKDNLASVERLLVEYADDSGYCESAELQQEQLRLAIKGLEDKSEAEVRKGLVIDLVDMADITVSDEAPSISRYLDSPWISHRSYLRLHQVKALFPELTSEELKNLDSYSQKKPRANDGESGALTEFNATDADAYQSQTQTHTIGQAQFCCAEEIWDRDTNQVITLIRGLKGYARQPYAPNAPTTRFFPFFGLIFTDTDGQRWPQSLNQRSQSLQDAYSRAISAFEEHRSRIKPKTVFQAGMMDDTEATKLAKGATQEMVPIKTTNPKQDMRQLLIPVAYAPIDMAVYDTRWIMQNFELVWGLQDAMTGSIDAAKTATEAEIQQGGTNSRSADKRDQLEEVLSELAQYTGQVAIQMISPEEVVVMAGPQALWPAGIDPEQLDRLGVVSIRAGSSGKPNSRQQREVWGAVMPMISELIDKIAMLRNSNPLDVAEKYEQLVVETAARSGEQLDPTRFIPDVGEPVMLIDPTTLQPVMAFPSQIPPPAGAGMPGMPGTATAPPNGAGPPPSTGPGDKPPPPQMGAPNSPGTTMPPGVTN
jgi:hypothetical protein